MARSVAWRRNINEIVCWRQTEAENATIYILRETGPTGFLLKEEGEPKNVKVFLGDPHSCTCTQFKKDKDLCKHISWLLLKKFRISKENPLAWQLGLVEREINEVLHGVQQQQHRQEKKLKRTVIQASEGREVKGQREISEDDVCPICQDELLAKHLPVTYCKFGCGNSVHMKCMKIWAEHQQGKGDINIKCPMCREDFGPFNLLKEEMRNANGGLTRRRNVVRQDRHLGSDCLSCHTSPIEGKCYRCVVCAEFMLCQSCFKSPIHTHHQFEYRQKRNERWQRVKRRDNGVLPEAVVNDLLNRDITENDYDYLLQLESNQQFDGNNLTDEEINALPQEKVREGGQLLAPGIQCRLCLRGYQVGQFIRRLPCRHKFHKDCVDNWLLHTRSSCPIDGYLISSPLQEIKSPNHHRERRASVSSTESAQRTINSLPSLVLEIPGVSLIPSTRTDSINRQKLCPRVRSNHKPHRAPTSLELTGAGLISSYDRMNNPSYLDNTQNSQLPENQLLVHVEENWQAITNTLSSVSRTDVVNDIESCSLPVVGNSRSSLYYNTRRPPVMPPTSLKPTESSNSRRDRTVARQQNSSIKHQYLRHRPSSGNRCVSSEQILSQALQQAHDLDVQNLYLGNNPRSNPSEQGTLYSTTNCGQLKHKSIVTPSNTGTLPSDPKIQLEGLGLENITLRDIIH